MVLFVHPPKWVLQNRSHENAQLTAPTSQNFIEGVGANLSYAQLSKTKLPQQTIHTILKM